MAHLFGDQHVVDSLLGQQLLVRALLHHHAALEDGDAVGVLDGGQTVRHDDARPAFTGLVQSLLHHLHKKKKTRVTQRNLFLFWLEFPLNKYYCTLIPL